MSSKVCFFLTRYWINVNCWVPASESPQIKTEIIEIRINSEVKAERQIISSEILDMEVVYRD